MILRDDDVFVLPHGVEVRDARLYDAVRRWSWPLNDTGAVVLGSSGSSVGDAASRLESTYGVERERACRDVALFAARMNELLLLNVRCRARFRRWCSLALALLPLRRLAPWPARRVALRRRRLAVAALALTPHAVMVTAAHAAPLVAAGIVAPHVAFAVAAAAGLGLVLHELGHLAALAGVPAALATKGARVFVLHPRLDGARRTVVALAGPLAPTLAGGVCVAVAAATDAATLACAGSILAMHAFGMTVAARDGRTACAL